MTITPSASRTIIVPVAYRTVTPEAGVWCDPASSFVWPIKPLVGTLDYWLDASLECAADSDSVVMFSYSQVYGDAEIEVISQITVGNVCGLLLSGGTAAGIYAFRIQAVMQSNRRIPWDVALVVSDSVAWPTATNRVTLNGAVLIYAGRTLPVVNGP
jgi:hypothetical protein